MGVEGVHATVLLRRLEDNSWEPVSPTVWVSRMKHRSPGLVGNTFTHLAILTALELALQPSQPWTHRVTKPWSHHGTEAWTHSVTEACLELVVFTPQLLSIFFALPLPLRVSLCSPGWSGTCSGEQASLRFVDLLASAPRHRDYRRAPPPSAFFLFETSLFMYCKVCPYGHNLWSR